MTISQTIKDTTLTSGFLSHNNDLLNKEIHLCNNNASFTSESNKEYSILSSQLVVQRALTSEIVETHLPDVPSSYFPLGMPY